MQKIPFGLWPSPLSPDTLARGLRLSDIAWDSDGQTLLWLEGRSDRGVLVCSRLDGDAPRDLTAELSVRARVGYGGGDIAASHGHAYFVSGGRIYRQALNAGDAQPITPAFGDGKVDGAADPTISTDGRWVLYVHSYENQDCLAVVNSESRAWPLKLVSGADFYMQPAWHPGGEQIAWVAWDHPNMPWDDSRLHLATLSYSGGAPCVVSARVLAGGSDTAVFQPEFSPDGRYLAYVSDATGWNNLYLYDLLHDVHLPLVTTEAELAPAAWAQGMRSYAWSPDSAKICYTRSESGSVSLWSVDLATRATRPVAAMAEYSDVTQLCLSNTGRIAAIASSPRSPTRVVVYDPAASRPVVVARSDGEIIAPALLSEPQPVKWQSSDGDMVNGLYYAPHSDQYEGAGKPPLIVSVHGGPTGQAVTGYFARAQFFTTRGYAVLDVNYRGSSGYGRAYRRALSRQWGIYDADDAVSGARYLAGQGLADAARMVVMGGSAGGYTVLQCLIRYPGAFKAGLCLYGVTNLFTLASDTHKLEQHYLDSMIGPLPETAQQYRDRSPVFHADLIRDPVAVFQGQEDRVVPVDQAETIVAALRRSGVPHEYHLYPGEGHGWRKTETIQAFYKAVLHFLQQHVLFA
jgi:dipeptidyl aminopeptidase/acylaminoacyl peptidase